MVAERVKTAVGVGRHAGRCQRHERTEPAADALTRQAVDQLTIHFSLHRRRRGQVKIRRNDRDLLPYTGHPEDYDERRML